MVRTYSHNSHNSLCKVRLGNILLQTLCSKLHVKGEIVLFFYYSLIVQIIWHILYVEHDKKPQQQKLINP